MLLADCVVGDEGLHEILNLLVVVFEHKVLFGCEHHIFDCFNFRWRAGHSDLFGVGFYKGCAPFLEVETGAFVDQGFKLIREFLFLRGAYGIFELHHTFGIARTAGSLF